MSVKSREIRLVLLVLAAVVAVLAVLWFALLRTEYVPVYQNIREADASAIIAELDTAGIPYRLANDGHDIFVPKEQASEARVAVAGSDISFGGTVGFELFNDSDMGLTEFAQKINFQRAMQGELSRTIMMMEGVEFARVHLAIPERTIFRSAQGSPSAAVTIEMSRGGTLTPQQIVGIQQLVASSMPGLSTIDVAILDKGGNLVSTAVSDAPAAGAAASTERGALESFYAIRARNAVEDVLPELRFDIELTARQRQADSGPAESDEASAQPVPSVQGREDLALRVLIRTPQDLAEDNRLLVQKALVEALDLAEWRGDALAFSTGMLSPTLPGGNPATVIQAPAPAVAEPAGDDWSWSPGTGEVPIWRWPLIILAGLGLVLLVAWPRRRLAREEAASFAELLKAASAEKQDRSRG